MIFLNNRSLSSKAILINEYIISSVKVKCISFFGLAGYIKVNMLVLVKPLLTVTVAPDKTDIDSHLLINIQPNSNYSSFEV